jgi:catechol 2,3-dioxygenase-like lactoylglutathione lyase family enzyme
MSTFEVQQIDHVELFVPDQRAAAAWYGRVFGLRVLPEFEHWAGDGPLMVSTRDAGTKLALFAGEPLKARARAAFRRVAFRVDGAGFAAFLARLQELELATETGAPVGPGDWVDHGAALSIYFTDPWHHRFEVTTYDVVTARALIT